MRTYHVKKKVGDLPHILWKRGLVRQGFKHHPKTPTQKRHASQNASTVMMRARQDKAFKKVDCGCGCQGR